VTQASYREFLENKRHVGAREGFAATNLPSFLFDFQAALVEWAVGMGRCAIFADCGLGKTAMELAWGEQVAKHAGRPVLLLSPLAVSHQIEREAQKFGIDAVRSDDGRLSGLITLTNYERLHHFRPEDFAGTICDESSILKSFDGARQTAITAFMRKMPYRLLATATAAPNDYIELGTSSEALGNLGHMDMLNRFFKNDLNNSFTGRMRGEVSKWRFKGHAELPFWRWVTSWARAMRKPSDLGFSDEGFVLPPLREVEHLVDVQTLPDGMLFALPAVGLKEQREERRRSMQERCEKVAELVNSTGKPALVWCHMNDEGDLLERLIPDAVQVAGKDSDENKESRLLDFADGNARVLVSKQKIGGWGLNFQHCAHVVTFPSHSFEGYYQGVRRCWRFGQKSPVTVDIVRTEGDGSVLKNMQRKASQADAMFERLVAEMNNALRIDTAHGFHTPEKVPSWLSKTN